MKTTVKVLYGCSFALMGLSAFLLNTSETFNLPVLNIAVQSKSAAYSCLTLCVGFYVAARVGGIYAKARKKNP